MTVLPVDVRDRTTWAAVAGVVAGLLLSLGFLFLVGGLGVATTGDAYEVVRAVPGGMRAHGGALVAVGLAVVAGLVPPIARRPYRHRYLRAVLMLVCAYSAWIVFAFLAAWHMTGTVTAAPAVWWVVCLALCIVLIVRAPHPPSTTPREGEPCYSTRCRLSRD